MENEMICSDIKDMDIKLGGREMATVVYSNEEVGLQNKFEHIWKQWYRNLIIGNKRLR
ncbi:MAG: hypothetical protein SO445_08070 [Lachnospiraceae bacterium]|nr:hypothetical protein [Lachnospiraceae bacterium]MDD7378277.1 hypothetical protein [Lachnospiraceae bacterium]MDY4617648.1 hypothetical protein [Lachnospiraceae bacterium]